MLEIKDISGYTSFDSAADYIERYAKSIVQTKKEIDPNNPNDMSNFKLLTTRKIESIKSLTQLLQLYMDQLPSFTKEK